MPQPQTRSTPLQDRSPRGCRECFHRWGHETERLANLSDLMLTAQSLPMMTMRMILKLLLDLLNAQSHGQTLKLSSRMRCLKLPRLNLKCWRQKCLGPSPRLRQRIEVCPTLRLKPHRSLSVRPYWTN